MYSQNKYYFTGMIAMTSIVIPIDMRDMATGIVIDMTGTISMTDTIGTDTTITIVTIHMKEHTIATIGTKDTQKGV